MIENISYHVANPWPEPEKIAEVPSKILRVWSVRIETCMVSDSFLQQLGQFLSHGSSDVEIRHIDDVLLHVVIYSPHPDIADPLETITETSRILKKIDNQFHITHIQGIPKEKWLMMK